MKLFITPVIILLACSTALAKPECPTGEPTTGQKIAVFVAASIIGLKNACVRADPSREQQYSEALDKLLRMEFTATDLEEYECAKASPLFPAELREAEAKLKTTPAATITSDCAGILNLKSPR